MTADLLGHFGAAHEYRIDHRAPGPGGGTDKGGCLRASVPLHQVRSLAHGTHVSIYRAVPLHVREINPGDWVSLHGDWTQERAGSAPGLHVLHARVPARHVYLDAAERDDDEAGYHGPPLNSVPLVAPSAAHREQVNLHEAAARPGRGEKDCLCCHGNGEHEDGSRCTPCGSSGMLPQASPQEYCDGQPRPRRRHWREPKTAMTRREDYGYQHAPRESASPIHEYTDIPGVQENPYRHTQHEEAVRQFRSARGNPEHPVRIYRSMPAKGRGQINPGDWVTTAHEYAKDMAEDRNYHDPDSLMLDPLTAENLQHVYEAVVPARHVRGGGNDLSEWGYWGTEIRAAHSRDCYGGCKGLSREAMAGVDDYGGSHRPMDSGPEVHDVTPMWGDDVYTHPQYHVGNLNQAALEGFRQLLQARGKPDHPVIVYRASPPGSPRKMHTGDWVSLSRRYAYQHLDSMAHPEGWFVHKATVPARHVRDAGMDPYREHGYWGPDIESEKDLGPMPRHLHEAALVHRLGYHEGGEGNPGVCPLCKPGAEHLGAWQPSQRIFGPTYGLDHRLFDEHGKLRPEVRQAVLEKMDQAIRVDIQIAGSEWQDVTTLYLAGSEASEWSGPDLEGNNDLDILVDIDYDEWRGHGNSHESAFTDDQITSAFNAAMRGAFNDPAWHTDFGTYNVTGYCNGRPIEQLKPYALYNISKDHWEVHPPHLPEWNAGSFPQGKGMFAEGRALIAQVRAILRLPSPFREQEATRIWAYIREGRKRAFSIEGEGWLSIENVLEKMLDQAPGQLVDKLKAAVYGEDKAPMALGHGMTTADLSKVS